jgi:uncharacterized protein
LLDLLGDFIAELRAAGIPVSMSEHVDAARAVEVIDLGQRSMVRGSLAATLVKDGDHLPVFYTAFDVFFATRSWQSAQDFLERRGPVGRVNWRARAARPDRASCAGWAAAPPRRSRPRSWPSCSFARCATATPTPCARRPPRRSPATPAWSRAVRSAAPTTSTAPCAASTSSSSSRASARWPWPTAATEDELAQRISRDDARERVEKLKAEIERVIRERLVQDRGAPALAKSVRKPLPEDLDVMHANRDEMAQLERALRPLSRKLATRLARKRRRRRRGPVDLRHTVRRSLSTGGVPMDLRFKPPRPAKPEIVVIADISGSVASFARFTLHLVHAISSQFSKVRSFVFVDGLDEVTALFEGADDPADAVARINAEADVIAFDGHSDYGRALTSFHERFADGVTMRTTILILGDARNNYHQAHAEVLADLAYRAKALYWLNPEPMSYWNSGDSIVSQYAPYCERVIECRTLRQLEAFVGELA